MGKTLEDLKKMAKDKGWILNQKEKITLAILNRQNIRMEKSGEYYCPCKPETIPENICNPCINSPNEIAEDGHCHCNLFHDPNWNKTKADKI